MTPLEPAPPIPRVLCLSGHDPGGGAGIHADIEAVAAQGVHALTVITALTVQNTRDVRRVSATAPALIAEQIEALIEDGPIAAIKIGLLGDAMQVRVIVETIRRLRVPVVFDPVLRAGGGSNLVGAGLLAELIAELLPEVSLLTPNASEARRLAPGSSGLDDCALRLLALGCTGVLVTGGDEPGDEVCNTWYSDRSSPRHYRWPRLPETFHGAGCTLASAIAARLARGDSMEAAIDQAQRWTQVALSKAIVVGEGRRIPLRERVY
ncbi:MAG: bifunctional hydroxymethylpyrimidine kinase/phosphomethylpyrimidine kinase [Panacagrimonas sp.]